MGECKKSKTHNYLLDISKMIIQLRKSGIYKQGKTSRQETEIIRKKREVRFVPTIET